MFEPEGPLVAAIALGFRGEPGPKLAKRLRLGSGPELLVVLEDLQGNVGKLVSDLIAREIGTGAVLEGINFVKHLSARVISGPAPELSARGGGPGTHSIKVSPEEVRVLLAKHNHRLGMVGREVVAGKH